MRIAMLFLLVTMGCGASTGATTDWEPLDEENLGGSDGKDDTDAKSDTDGKSDTDTPLCGPEVSDGASCQGDWTTTLCADDEGVLWWCEDGAWTADK